MPYRVFAQRPPSALDGPALLATTRGGEARLEALAPSPEGVARIQVHLGSGSGCIYTVRSRPVFPRDLEDARAAEIRGRASGMATLAERCDSVWEVAPEDRSRSDDAQLLELCAVLAFAALGPVLPPDGSTLFGVRGARERAQRASRE